MKNTDDLSKRVQILEDKMALKELVDTFSTLSDGKEAEKQTLLFTESAIVETLLDGQVISSLKGRHQIGAAFDTFLKQFEIVYHINGQQTVKLNGDQATGTCYCFVTLIGMQDGRRMKTSIGIYYNDAYVREGGQWLIARRTSVFAWRDQHPFDA